ncbi:MAG: hypothetical protein ABIP94_21515 [Planctomycetota bacterium]
MARFYIDPSAYLGVLTRDEHAAGLAAELRGAAWFSSVVFVLEVQRNLVRLAREKYLSTDDYLACGDRLRSDLEGFSLRDVTLDLCLPTMMPATMLPRSLDLLHLRTAMWFHAQSPLTRFVSLDHRQNQSARELGMPV